MTLHPTSRFSNRVENYLRYRPHYPAEIVKYLKKENVLKNDSVIADIGSGTGFSSEVFLNNGNTVYGVEPNKEMREAGEKYLSGYKNFISVNGTAEETTLNANSIDLIIAGQAFHWFNIVKAKKEFKRIIKIGGWGVVMWNVRQSAESEFARDYGKLLLKFGTDYKQVRRETLNRRKLSVFNKDSIHSAGFANSQIFNYSGLRGRLLSSSYAPGEGHMNYIPMLNELKEIFEKYQHEGKVEFKYMTEIHFGKI